MAHPDIKHVSDSSFEADVLNSEVPVLVDFWAEWCGPCKAIAPILDAAAAEFSGQLRIVKLDIDHNPATAMKYGVRSIPTLLIFKGKDVAAQHVGALNRSALGRFVSKVL